MQANTAWYGVPFRREHEECHSEPERSEGEESRKLRTFPEILRPAASE